MRDTEVRGLLDARDFTDLTIDGLDLFYGLSLHQRAEGTFAKLQLLKCNLLDGSKIVFDRPAGPKTKMEKVRVERFFFGTLEDKPETGDKQIADRIDDGADSAAVSVKAFWEKPEDRRHVFVDKYLMGRRPPAPP